MEERKEDNEFKYEYTFTKSEENSDGDLYIYGLATSDEVDHDGEIVDAESVKSAWGDYQGVIKYMHGKDTSQLAAIGKVVPEYVDKAGKTWKTEFTERGPTIVAKISNAPDTESIRMKVREGVISGLSIGGRARRVKTFDPTLQKDVNRVITTRISEISLVDLPANKSSYFEVLKAACVGDNCPLNDGTEPIEKTDPVVEDPIVSRAVAKFEEIINENNDMKDTLEKLEEQIEGLERANDPITVVKGEENENNDHISTINKAEVIENRNGGITMEENDGIVRMEVDELTKYIRDTVTDMSIEQETVEKLEDYDRLVREIGDMRKKIENLEAEAIKNAKALKTTPAMKSEGDVETETVEKAAKKKKDEKEKKFDDDGNEIIEENSMDVIKKLESDIAELKSSPLYKAQQEEVVVEKTESEPASGVLAGVISAHYGGN